MLPQGLSPQLLDGALRRTCRRFRPAAKPSGDQTRDARCFPSDAGAWCCLRPSRCGPALVSDGAADSCAGSAAGIDSATLVRELSYIAPADPYLPLPRAVDWYRYTIAESDADDSQRRASLERPDYLLVLGDLHQVSENITSVLCSYGHFVGRLAFSDEAGQPRLTEYRQYAEKAAAAADRDGPAPDDEEDDERGEPSRVAEGIKVTPGLPALRQRWQRRYRARA